jgi:hypothetical protein
VQKKKVQTERDREALLGEVEAADRASPKWKDVDQVCRQIAKRLKAVEDDFERKRGILILLVTKIILEQRTVRIKCAIPFGPSPTDSSPCHIAFQLSGRRHGPPGPRSGSSGGDCGRGVCAGKTDKRVISGGA